MTTARRRRVPALLLLPLLLPGCRSWERFEAVPPAELRAAVTLFLRARYDRDWSQREEGGVFEAGFTASSPGMVVLFIILTAGLLLPFEERLELAVRSDGARGSELAIEASRHWQLFVAFPMWLHDEALEGETRAGVLAQLERRVPDQAAASAAVLELVAAVRAGDAQRFRACLWSAHGQPDARSEEWLRDGAFWAAERATTEERVVQVSWPPHARTGPGPTFFGFGGGPVEHEALWVSLRMGQVQRRFEAVQAEGGWRVALPLGEDGALSNP